MAIVVELVGKFYKEKFQITTFENATVIWISHSHLGHSLNQSHLSKVSHSHLFYIKSVSWELDLNSSWELKFSNWKFRLNGELEFSSHVELSTPVDLSTRVEMIWELELIWVENSQVELRTRVELRTWVELRTLVDLSWELELNWITGAALRSLLELITRVENSSWD